MKVLSIDLVPQRVQKRRLLSEITPGIVTPRHRDLDCRGEDKPCSALQVCKNKIIVGWETGTIKIFNSSDLSGQTVLPYYMNEAGVTCFQCTCTEIIAGYDDGNICVCDVWRGTFSSKLEVGTVGLEADYATSLRWRDPKLLVAFFFNVQLGNSFLVRRLRGSKSAVVTVMDFPS